MILDSNWTVLRPKARGFRAFIYSSDIDFVLVKTDGRLEFQRIMPLGTEADLSSIEWNNRARQEYYIFRLDPIHQVVVIGSAAIRFFRCPQEKLGVASFEKLQIKTNPWQMESLERSWEMEDVYHLRKTDGTSIDEARAEIGRRFKAWKAMTEGKAWQVEPHERLWELEDMHPRRIMIVDRSFTNEDCAEVARRFKAWRAVTEETLFVFLMIPKRLSEGECIQLREGGVQIVDDVPWVLRG